MDDPALQAAVAFCPAILGTLVPLGWGDQLNWMGQVIGVVTYTACGASVGLFCYALKLIENRLFGQTTD